MLLPKLLQISKGIESGIHPDGHDVGDHLWKDGRNVEFTPNSVRKMAGWSDAFSSGVSVPIRGMGQLLDSGGQKLFFGTTTDLWMWNAVSVTNEGTGYAGNLNGTVNTPASHWSFVEFGNWMLATNGVDALQIWKGTSFAALGGTPPTKAEVLMKLGPYVIAFGTDLGNTFIEWCDEDNVENWVVGSGGSTAGNLELRDFDSAIIACAYLGKQIAIYGRDRVAILGTRPVPFFFGVETALTGIGAVSKYSSVSVGRMNYGLSDKGFFVTDGQTFNYIDDGVIRRFVLDSINWAQASKVVGLHNATKTQVEWYYPTTTGEPDIGVAYNYQNKVWTILDHGRTAADERRVFQYPVVATKDGEIFFRNFGVDANGVAMTSYIQSRPLEMADEGQTLEDFIKYIDAIKVKVKGIVGTNVRLQIGVQESLKDPVFFTEDILIDDDLTTYYPNISGKYVTIRLESSGVGDDWQLFGVILHGKSLGYHA